MMVIHSLMYYSCLPGYRSTVIHPVHKHCPYSRYCCPLEVINWMLFDVYGWDQYLHLPVIKCIKTRSGIIGGKQENICAMIYIVAQENHARIHKLRVSLSFSVWKSTTWGIKLIAGFAKFHYRSFGSNLSAFGGLFTWWEGLPQSVPERLERTWSIVIIFII